MEKSKFTEDQIRMLLSNKNVAKCSDKAITYNKDFKVWAVQQYLAGKTGGQIFREAGFDQYVVGKDTLKKNLKRWRRIFSKHGVKGLATENRGRKGGRPKTKGTDAERIRWLEAENAYLKEANSFLAKLRAKRAE